MDFILDYSNKMRNPLFNILQINDLPGYPLHSHKEDIHKMKLKVNNQDIEDIVFEDFPKNNFNPSNWNEKTFEEDPSGDDLDVPGSEVDDDQEAIGNEDEENNLASLAQDEQNDMEND